MWRPKRFIVIGMMIAGLAAAGFTATNMASASEIHAKPATANQAQTDTSMVKAAQPGAIKAIKPAVGCTARQDRARRFAFSIGCGPANRWWRVWAYCRSASGQAAYGYSRWYRGAFNMAVARCNSYFIYGAGIQYY